jgi:DNA-binding phage protein
MTKITIDEQEFDTKDFTDAQNEIVSILNLGQNSITLIDHMVQCVRAIQNMKTNELKDSLGIKDEAEDKK